MEYITCPTCHKKLNYIGQAHACEPTAYGQLAGYPKPSKAGNLTPKMLIDAFCKARGICLKGLVALGLLLVPSMGFAQDEDWHPVDHPTTQATTPSAPIVVPKHLPTFDKRFTIVTGLHLAATIADTETTRHFLMGNRCEEQNVLLGPRPSTAAVYGLEVVGLFGVTTVATFFWKRHLERYGRSHETTAAWATLPVILTVGHGVAAWDNGSCF